MFKNCKDNCENRGTTEQTRNANEPQASLITELTHGPLRANRLKRTNEPSEQTRETR